MSKTLCLAGLLTILSQLPPSLIAQEPVRPVPFMESDTLLVFAPFNDHSGFSGKWNLRIDIPRFLSAYCKQRFQVGVVGPVTVAYFDTTSGITSSESPSPLVIRLYAQEFHSRYIVAASVEGFSITRFLIAEQRLAGYEAFAAEVSLKFSLYDAARIDGEKGDTPLFEGEAAGIVKDKALGITLFGKQTERTNQYFSLDELYFGGDQFNKTIIGEAMLKCAEDLSSKLEKAVPLLKTKTTIISTTIAVDSTKSDSLVHLTRRVVRGEIVLVDSDEVFINIGSDEGVKVGDVLGVFGEGVPVRDPKTNEIIGTADLRIGEVQVIEVRGAHFSMATILKGKGTIRPRSKVRAVVVR